MNGIWLAAGCLVVMMFLGFGCLGGKTLQVQQPQTQAAGNIGDSDISPQGQQNDSSALSEEDVVPVDESYTNVSTGNDSGTNVSTGPASDFSDSDIDVIDISDSDLISAEDVVGADN